LAGLAGYLDIYMQFLEIKAIIGLGSRTEKDHSQQWVSACGNCSQRPTRSI
jgi:hypothetical protein